MAQHRMLFLFVSCFATAWVCSADAQQSFDCPFKSSTKDPLAYRARGPSHCEGLLEQNRSQRAFTLIGFWTGAPPRADANEMELIVGAGHGAVTVAAVSYDHKNLYRMDGRTSYASPLVWRSGPDDIAGQLGLSPEKIALVAWKGRAERVYVPVYTEEQSPAEKPRFVLRPAVDLAPFYYRFITTDTVGEWQMEFDHVWAFDRIEIPARVESGVLEVKGMTSSRTWTETQRFTFDRRAD